MDVMDEKMNGTGNETADNLKYDKADDTADKTDDTADGWQKATGSMAEGNRQQVSLVGIGMGAAGTLTEEARRVISECDCLIGAGRMLEAVCANKSADKSDVQKCGLKPLAKEEENHGTGAREQAIYCAYEPERIREILTAHPEYRKTAVLYSGDIGFYSGARELRRVLADRCEVKGIPGISSVVYLAARLGISWEDARLTSIHGRNRPYIHILARHRKTFLLFGGNGLAEEFCSRIREYGLTGLRIWIGRNLSYKEESIVCRTGADIQPEDLKGLSALYVENPSPLLQGVQIRDDAFIRGNVPMTKEEVRFVSLASLALSGECVFYDIGAGTGSIAVTAAALHENAQVYAVERKAEAVELIRQNKRKFCVDQLEIIEGTAPEALQDLKPPTHVFIGGSSGNLEGILKCIREKNPSAKVVLNAITLETVKEVLLAEEKGLLREVEIIQAGFSRAKKTAGYHMMTAQNPIYIITAGMA